MLKNRYLNIYESLDFDVKVFRNRDFEDSGVIRDRAAAGDAGKPLEKYIERAKMGKGASLW